MSQYAGLIDWLLNNEKSLMEKITKNQYYNMYKEISEKTGLPISFIQAHSKIESNENPNAKGKLNEIGLWQFLPSTWRTLMGNAPPNLQNQKEAYIKHSLWILSKTKDLKNFLWIWNAGYGNYQKNILPKITKSYIQNVMRLV